MLMSVLDFAQQAITAYGLTSLASGNIAGIAAASAATVGLGALKGIANSATAEPESNTMETDSLANGSSASSNSASLPSSIGGGSSGGGNYGGSGGNNIMNIYNPVFISDSGINEFFNKAKSMGYTVTKSDYQLAGA
jgi:hypothetical protein